MQHYILADDVTTDISVTEVPIAHNDGIDYGLAHVAFDGGTGTVSIQGRLDATMPFIEISSYTTDGMERITAAPNMRVVTSSLSGATIRVIFRM